MAEVMAENEIEKFREQNPYVEVESRGGTFFVPPEAEGEAGGIIDASEAAGLQKTTTGDMPTPKASGLKTLESFLEEAQSIDEASPIAKGNYNVVKQVIIVTDDWTDPGHCWPTGDLKPRRPVPHVRVSKLLGGVKKQGQYYVHAGALNDWPSMQGLVLASIRVDKDMSKQAIWTAKSQKELPSAEAIKKALGGSETGVAHFLAPSWTTVGWEPESPGFVFWFSEQFAEPRMPVGNDLIKVFQEDPTEIRDAHVTDVHYYVHRYPVEKSRETERDRNEWHCFVMLEWQHKKFVTVVESAFFCGVAGFGGKSNWCADKLTAEPAFLKVAHPQQIQPWDTTKSEYRIWDVPVTSQGAFDEYLHKFSEKGGLPQREQRFLMPKLYMSKPKRIRSLRMVDVACYVLNYSQRCPTYNVPYSNCMTFTTDLFAFFTAMREVSTYHPGLRPFYRQHILSFMYVPSVPS